MSITWLKKLSARIKKSTFFILSSTNFEDIHVIWLTSPVSVSTLAFMKCKIYQIPITQRSHYNNN